MSIWTKPPQPTAWRSVRIRPKLMTNNTSGINIETKVNGQKLETVTSFKYLDSVITDEGSKILSRIAHATAD